MKKITEFLATGFYTGYIRPGPGSWGSWTALCLYVILARVLPFPAENIALVLAILSFFIGLVVAQEAAETLREKDPQCVVIDEFCGTFLTFVAVPFSYTGAILGFILFRFFDIAKPYPIQLLQSWKGSLGILMDDVSAGLYAALSLSFLLPWAEKAIEIYFAS
ncbi:MAG: phosphatidylglycerophosphatase A [Leptospiraceae bacterium]|nr:phosphatidylglycerophosphatase A [Leptospiraceae bacterium]MDW8307554.1 phosphatidylglycerophosphatase A [Leptospiraceae bacterium]